MDSLHSTVSPSVSLVMRDGLALPTITSRGQWLGQRYVLMMQCLSTNYDLSVYPWMKWSMHQEGRTGLRWPYGVRRSCLCTDPERVRCCRSQYQESRPCHTCVDGNELMLDPRSVCVSSGDRSGRAVFQPGIQRSCQSTAGTAIVSVG